MRDGGRIVGSYHCAALWPALPWHRPRQHQQQQTPAPARTAQSVSVIAPVRRRRSANDGHRRRLALQVSGGRPAVDLLAAEPKPARRQLLVGINAAAAAPRERIAVV